MENLFNPTDTDAIILRIDSINSESKRLWGEMEVSQMIVHLRAQLDIALGNKPATKQGPFLFRTLVGRWVALYVAPWGKGKQSTPKEMDTAAIGINRNDFEIDKKLLLTRIKEFIAATDFAPHPFFGKISDKDWGRLAWKHINHHLWQFGA